MSTTIIYTIDSLPRKFIEIIFFLNKWNFSDTTTPSTFVEDVCQNQTQSPLGEIEDRINVVVPYLVILGTCCSSFPDWIKKCMFYNL